MATGYVPTSVTNAINKNTANGTLNPANLGISSANSGKVTTGSTQRTNYGSSTGSSGSSGRSYSSSGSSGYSAPTASAGSGSSAWNQALSAIQSAQNNYLAALKASQEAQQKARDDAYNKAAAQQETNYNYSKGQVEDATAKALQEAYVNRMLQQKNLQQSLTAQGLNGGASETTTAGMYNNYNNARNELETEKQNQLGSLLNTYQNNLASLEQQRASGTAASLSDYQTALSNLAANNTTNLVNLLQGYGSLGSLTGNTTATYDPTTGQWIYS